MLIVVLAFASLLIIAWLLLLGRVAEADWLSAAYVKVVDDLAGINKLSSRDKRNNQRLSDLQGITAKGMRLLVGGDSSKKIKKLECDIACLKKGEFKSLNIFVMPGYVLQREFSVIGKGSIHKTILAKNLELYGKKHGMHKTKHLLAKLLSYPVIGVAVVLAFGVILLGTDNTSEGMAMIGIGSLLTLILGVRYVRRTKRFGQ
jgi:membrane protein implicated in regulation of membrane protease activity